MNSYPAPNGYLADAVSKHLKPVDYDRWSELYWKKEIEGNLTEEEQKELEKPEPLKSRYQVKK